MSEPKHGVKTTFTLSPHFRKRVQFIAQQDGVEIGDVLRSSVALYSHIWLAPAEREEVHRRRTGQGGGAQVKIRSTAR